MQTNKFGIELSIPAEKNEEALPQLNSQAELLVQWWKAITLDFKKAGFDIPQISLKKSKPKLPDAQKVFNKTLLDHHLQFAPNAQVGPQMVVIKQLWETGLDAKTLINLYEKSRAEYAFTSWHTVKYRLTKNKAECAVELSEDKIKDIRERYTQ